MTNPLARSSGKCSALPSRRDDRLVLQSDFGFRLLLVRDSFQLTISHNLSELSADMVATTPALHRAVVEHMVRQAVYQRLGKTLPTPGAILAELTDGKMGGPEHDRAAPERIKQTIY